jgi:hypothetical protein
MNKVPVSQTIATSFSFVFENYLSLLGILWLPMGIQGVVGYLVMVPFFRDFLVADRNSAPIQMFPMIVRIFLFDIVAIALLAMMSVGVTRRALRLRTDSRFIYYTFGAADLRVLGGYILTSLICAALVAAIVVLVSLANLAVTRVTAPEQAPPTVAILVQAILVFAAELASLYVGIRLSSFSTVVAVTEHRFGLWRSWALTKGNFWQIFVIILVVTIPMFIVETVMASFTVGPVMAKFAMINPNSPREALVAAATLMNQWMPYLPYCWLGWIVVSPVAYGLLVAPAAFAYRLLVADPTAAETS